MGTISNQPTPLSQQGYITNLTGGSGGCNFDSAVLLSRNSWMIPMLALVAVNVCVILVFGVKGFPRIV